jgi:hypothetical protein
MYASIPLLDKLPLSPMSMQDLQEDKILKLIRKLEELSIQLANKKEGRPKPTNQHPNTWCGNGHLGIECPSPQLVPNAIDNKCGYCGKNHPMLQCLHLQVAMGLPQINQQIKRQVGM